MFRSFILAATLAAASSGVAAADPPGVITILEGEAQIFRGTARYAAAEGVRLALGDIVETGENTFMAIELADRSTAELGGITRVMINGSGGRKPDRWLYFMNGWGKISGTRRDPKAAPAFEARAPLFEIDPNPGVVVFQSTAIEVHLFVERGDVRVGERPRWGAALAVGLKAGDTYERKGYTRGSILKDPTPGFLAKMPRAFRDTLPSRIDRFKDREVRPREAPDFGYADVELWLKAEPSIRRQFVQRWRGKANDNAFRTLLIANLNSHPEWDPILFPEKYLPKEPPPPPPPKKLETARPAAGNVPATAQGAPQQGTLQGTQLGAPPGTAPGTVANPATGAVTGAPGAAPADSQAGSPTPGSGAPAKTSPAPPR